jgi:hypothetical protein
MLDRVRRQNTVVTVDVDVGVVDTVELSVIMSFVGVDVVVCV